MYMKKQILNKIIAIVLFILVVFTSFSLIYNQTDYKQEKEPLLYLNNNQFDTDLDGPTDLHPIDQFISMTTLYNEIKSRIDSVRNATEAEKATTDAEIVSWIEQHVGSSIISISNALELYMFGNAQSINFDSQGGINTYIFEETIKKVLSLNYALIDDIDYSTMKAQKFVPIGTDIFIEQGDVFDKIEIKYEFTGTFDGNGFEIRNLYLADFTYISTTFSDENESTAITVPTIKHYSMFSVIGETGVVKNFILRNPSYELIVMDDSADIFHFSSLVGENNGLIYNVGVIDKRVNTQGEDVSGITFTMLQPTTKYATAAGFVHTNNGTIKNSYYASKNIIAPTSMFRFSEVAPFVHTNTNTEGIVASGYENSAIVKPQGYNPSNIASFSDADLKAGNVNINSQVEDERRWYFYPDDGYPLLIGLEYVNDEYYVINNDYDLIAFSKLINLNTEVNNKTFDEHTYVLNKDINMINFKSYQTPSKEFKGILKGGDDDFTIGGSTNNNKYIYNLTLTKPHIIGNRYYLGLFSTLSGTVQNINLYQNEVKIESSRNDYGKTFYVGTVAGELRGGTVKNIINAGSVNLGTEPIGLTYAGGLVGLASGTITFVANTGTINGGSHDFDNKPINANFYLGGIVGSNNGKIEISYSQNKGIITAVGSTNAEYVVQEAVKTFTGGIIGEVNNIDHDTSSLVYLSNYGEINGSKFIGSSAKAYQCVGGIFGSVKGYGFKLNDGDKVVNGALENSGLIKGEYVNTNTYLYAAGIGVANTSEQLAKISYLSNHSSFSFTRFNYQTHNTNLFYASTIIDNSSGGIELSRAYNYQDYIFTHSYFTKDAMLQDPVEIKISPFFVSITDVGSKLLYVENKGSLMVGAEDSDVDVEKLLKVSNITQATRVDYQNVINSGDIKVLRLNNKNDSIYVSGIAWILPYVSRPYLMRDVVNDGDIYTAGIRGNTTVVGTVVGKSFSHTTFYGNLSVRNLYVGGIVNINVGEIVNAFNLGNITSKYNGSIYDIKGTANTFVGGLVTFNYNLVQDAANSGLIEYTNSSTESESNFAATENISTTNNSTFGGISIVYTGGLVLGGIVGAFGDVQGTELEGHAMGFPQDTPPVSVVIDISNNGDIYGKAKEYVRSGGILGIALSVELASGTYENQSNISNITPGPFTKAIIGSEDPVAKSLLSNGLNFGNVYAVTQTIGDYGTNFGTGTGANTANAMRPGINACAGGVIAYGLTQMVRMLNHGVISSTDVAGGIIGATYILGGPSQQQTPITTVNINTAVHYGRIKAIKKDNYNNFIYEEDENFNNTTKYYEDGNTSFIFAGVGSRDPARYQNGRRGFGGVFGRLQRGNYGTMSSTQFKNIMNMDSNIDMVGRVDSNMPGSLVYYRFYTGEDTYFTAKTNDTTPNALVGWFQSKNITFNFSNAHVQFTVERSGSYYYVTEIVVFSENTVIRNIHGNKTVMRPDRTSVSTASYSITRYVDGLIYETTEYTTSNRSTAFGLTTTGSSPDINPNGSFPQTVVKTNYTRDVTVFTLSGGTTSNPSNDERLRYPVTKVADDESDQSGLYIFDSSFPLMAAENSEYIYAVEADALASRFQAGGTNPKPNGMYVLASSTGSLDGATLPTNIRINNLYKLDETYFRYIDLNNVPISYKLDSDEYADKLNTNYEEMYQLSYNNKAEILPEDLYAQTKIAELTLYDPSGNSPTLTRGVVNYDISPKTITFTLSDSAFTQDQFYYEVKENLLSNKAVIARSTIDVSELSDFKKDYQDYLNLGYEVLDPESEFKFSYSGSVSSGSSISFPIKVYSEISIMDQNIFESGKYTETYNVIIIRQATGITTNATINLNPGTSEQATLNPQNIQPDYTVNPAYTLIPNGKIEVIFTGTTADVNNLIPLNHLMKVHRVLLVEGTLETEINPNYYHLTIIPKDTDNQFGFTIEFLDYLQVGTYKIEYSYYDNSAIRSITVNKRISDSHDIVDVVYDYFSSDLEGLSETFTRTSANLFTTYIEFGYQILGVEKSEVDLSFVYFEHDDNAPAYLDDIYYELYLLDDKIITIKIAPYARLNSAKIKYEYTELGKVKYILTYVIVNEIGIEDTITHEILERNPRAMQIFVDDNLQTSYSFTITREASLSKISIDFKFINNELYQNVIFSVSDADGIVNFTEDEIYEGNHVNMFILYITGLLDKGVKTYLFQLEREAGTDGEPGIYYELGVIEIEKLPGSSAYLLDIKFTLDDSEVIFEYPIIRATDSSGVIDNSYDPRVYADGIDYGTTIAENITHFKIDGKVSDIILEHYCPRFYLPYGATIERYDSITGEWVSNLYDDFAGGEDGVEKIVKYRVRSEDGQQEVVYFITAVDIKYNLTLRFKVYYEMSDGTLIEASDINSPIKNNFILISLKNLKLDDVYLTTGPKVSDFPEGISEENILGINTQSSLYYFTRPDTSTLYRFGRNSTGAYNFNIITPIYSGPKTDKLTPGERYIYEMYIMPAGVSDWKTDDYKLPPMSSVAENYSGLYYFVSSTSSFPITRVLAIVIKEQTSDLKWGLYDEYASWD